MAKHPHRTLRIIWKEKRKETYCDVFAPIILLNLRMVDLRLRKAGLKEITPLISDPAVWCISKHATSVFQQAYEFYRVNPDSIPFSDMLEATLPRVVAVLAGISPRVRVRFETNDLKES